MSEQQTVRTSEGEKGLARESRTGRLLRFLFNPPKLGSVPPGWIAYELAGVGIFNRFVERIAKHPIDLVTHLGMSRSNDYFAAGCPLELCDHAAARDLWGGVLYLDEIRDAIPTNDQNRGA